MPKWEYETTILSQGHVGRFELDHWGSKGWELVSVILHPAPADMSAGPRLVAYLKRRVAERKPKKARKR